MVILQSLVSTKLSFLRQYGVMKSAPSLYQTSSDYGDEVSRYSAMI